MNVSRAPVGNSRHFVWCKGDTSPSSANVCRLFSRVEVRRAQHTSRCRSLWMSGELDVSSGNLDRELDHASTADVSSAEGSGLDSSRGSPRSPAAHDNRPLQRDRQRILGGLGWTPVAVILDSHRCETVAAFTLRRNGHQVLGCTWPKSMALAAMSFGYGRPAVEPDPRSRPTAH
jgi:hypothetical protein